MITVKEAAKELDVSMQSVRNYIYRGLLPAIKERKGISFKFMISKFDLQAFANKYM